MEIDATSEIPVPASPVLADAEGFGTRPSRSRPHSISLHGPRSASSRSAVDRGVAVLLGIALGAAAMYCLVDRRD